ncbi:hypothetical protein ACE1CD_15755 [Aerosakkonema sp. BLCC-F183]|uniref:hypothetical protein n=1 Tax=Aerosakkonema sp. BLCC-F183 TaxID=3342834 RepID=UPI0035B7048E
MPTPQEFLEMSGDVLAHSLPSYPVAVSVSNCCTGIMGGTGQLEKNTEDLQIERNVCYSVEAEKDA